VTEQGLNRGVAFQIVFVLLNFFIHPEVMVVEKSLAFVTLLSYATQMLIILSKLAQVVRLLPCSRELVSSNICRDTGHLNGGYPGFILSLQGQCLEMGYDHFLQNPFIFTGHDHPVR
jgi:hypothetical protein